MIVGMAYHSEESKAWYLNELKARDIHGYSKLGSLILTFRQTHTQIYCKTMVENLR